MTQDEIRNALWSLSHAERLAFLVTSLIQDKRNSPALAVYSLLRMAQDFGQHLNQRDKIAMSERMRTAADELEHSEHQEPPVITVVN